MTKLAWGTVGTRTYEAGVDRGVLYVNGFDGVSWSGLISVKEKASGGNSVPYYLDGIKYLNISETEEFEASIDAFSSPDEFSACDGSNALYSGLFVTQQPRKSFGLSYRTKIGNDVDGQDHGYKIHLVYSALAGPSSRDNSTLSDTTNPSIFSWGITTTPPGAIGYKPTAHLIIDSTKTDPDLLAVLEGYLYGTDGIAPMMPTPAQLVSQFGTWNPMDLDADLKFIGTASSEVASITNLVTNPAFESVLSGTTVVRTNLAPRGNFEDGSVTGWNLGAITSSMDNFHSGTKSGRVIPTAENWGYIDAIPSCGVIPGKTYTFSIWVCSDETQNLCFTNYYSPSVQGASVMLEAGVWTRLSFTQLVPNTALNVWLSVRDPGRVRVPTPFYVDDFLVEQTDQLRPYFDGSTVDSLGFDYGWSGVVNASASTAKASVVEVRRNYAKNPAASSTSYGSSGSAAATFTGSVDTTVFHSGTSSFKKAITGTGQTGAAALPDSPTSLRINVGETVVWSFWVYSTKAGTLAPYADGAKVSDGTYKGFGGGASVTVPANTWTKVTGTTIGSIDDGYITQAGGYNLSVLSGDNVWFDEFLIEKSPKLGVYFDGNTSNFEDFINSWSGVVDASSAIQQGVQLNMVTTRVAAISSLNADSTKSMRLIPTGTSSPDSYVDVLPLIGGIGVLQLNTTYTLLGVIRLINPQTGSLAGGLQNRSIFVHLNGISTVTTGLKIAPNTVGSHILAITFTTPNTLVGYNSIRLYNGAQVGGGDVWWDDFALIEGDYTNSYFDGDTSNFIHQKQVVDPIWSGEPHASTSSINYLLGLPVASSNGDAYTVGTDLWVLIDDVWYNNGEVPLALTP